MPHGRRTLAALSTMALLAAAHPARGEPLFTLTDQGRTFLYRSRPGDHPALVAEMFGVGQRDRQALLAANGITDPTRVTTGFVYRIPNDAARALSQQASALEADNARLQRALVQAEEQGRQQAGEAENALARAASAETRAARAARLEWLWPIGQALLLVLALVTSAAVAVAVAALRRQRQAERFARSLSDEVEAKRKASLLERQESTRHILELEARVRSLEVQLGPRLLLGGRSS